MTEPTLTPVVANFIRWGCQYIYAGRYLALQDVQPISGNLFHSGIENLLKAGLLQSGYSVKQLKEMGHDLVKLWDSFKKGWPSDNLNAFDKSLQQLHDFEEIRYANSIEGKAVVMEITQNIVGPSLADKLAPSAKRFTLQIDRMDALVVEISKAMNVSFHEEFASYAEDRFPSVPVILESLLQ